jgi:hypothetical protein
MRNVRALAAAAALVIVSASAGKPALAQKSGGILRLQHFDSPASMSILEESTRATEQPMMGYSTTWYCTTSTLRRIASSQSFPIWQPNGSGAKTARS